MGIDWHEQWMTFDIRVAVKFELNVEVYRSVELREGKSILIQ